MIILAIDADQYDTKTVEFDLRDSYNKPLDDEILQNVVIWATDEDGNFTDAIDFTATTNTLTAVGDNFYSVANNVDSDSTFKATSNVVVFTISMLVLAQSRIQMLVPWLILWQMDL